MTKEEAIEVYNGLINPKIKEAFEFFVPELAESEDEKIRKELVSFVNKYYGEETKKEVLAYLEKQKIISDYLKANGVVIRNNGNIERHTIGYLTKSEEQNPLE